MPGPLSRTSNATVVAVGSPSVASDVALTLPRNPVVSGSPVRFRIDLPGAQPVRLELYDVAGRRVAIVHDGPLPAGTSILDWHGGGAIRRSGILMARLRTAVGQRVAKLIVLQ